MRITITEISADATVVRFTHDSGSADGVWLGQRPPQLGATDVDWSVPGRFWWQDDLRVRPARGGVIDLADASHPVTGTAVAYDDRGVLTLQIGDSRVLVDTNGKAPQQLIGETVEVDSMLIELTPTGER
ncbi:MAG: hypothetical protein Q7T55_14345 [Solirubrobacteraceae bacterium]|nr:hypothetical protein [Solirubrobacteraceae bacterium]